MDRFYEHFGILLREATVETLLLWNTDEEYKGNSYDFYFIQFLLMGCIEHGPNTKTRFIEEIFRHRADNDQSRCDKLLYHIQNARKNSTAVRVIENNLGENWDEPENLDIFSGQQYNESRNDTESQDQNNLSEKQTTMNENASNTNAPENPNNSSAKQNTVDEIAINTTAPENLDILFGEQPNESGNGCNDTESHDPNNFSGNQTTMNENASNTNAPENPNNLSEKRNTVYENASNSTVPENLDNMSGEQFNKSGNGNDTESHDPNNLSGKQITEKENETGLASLSLCITQEVEPESDEIAFMNVDSVSILYIQSIKILNNLCIL